MEHCKDCKSEELSRPVDNWVGWAEGCMDLAETVLAVGKDWGFEIDCSYIVEDIDWKIELAEVGCKDLDSLILVVAE